MASAEAGIVISRYLEISFSHLDEDVPCVEIGESGPLEVISIVSARVSDSKFATIVVSVGRALIDTTEKAFEEEELSAIFFDSEIILSSNVDDSGKEFTFQFDRRRFQDEIAIREVMRVFKIEDHWENGRKIVPD